MWDGPRLGICATWNVQCTDYLMKHRIGCMFLVKVAAELMAGWVPIDTADALELLSPAFKNEEHGVAWGRGPPCLSDQQPDGDAHAFLLLMLLVLAALNLVFKVAASLSACSALRSPLQVRSHAVSVLQQKDDEELLSYLLQLVQ
eukprot:scaffold51589_cov18-Tisochrysis_lutea.AAC.2